MTTDISKLIQNLERAAWRRSWSDVKAARKALEQALGYKLAYEPLDKTSRNFSCG